MGERTYNGGNCEVVLLSIVEELEDIISDDDSGLSAENVKGTHIVFIL